MANADFSKQSSTQGPRGFDSSSYREAKRAAAEQELTRIEDELKSKMMEIRS